MDVADHQVITNGNIDYSDHTDFWKQYLQPRTSVGDTVLHIAARDGDLKTFRDCFDALQAHSASVSLATAVFSNCNRLGKTPLHEAAQASNFDCVAFLLRIVKLEPDFLKQADWTPLMLACTKSNLKIIQALVEAGADLSLRNKDGWTPFHIACREGHTDILSYLLDIFPMAWNSRSKNGRTPLHTAALYGRLEAVNILLNQPIPVDQVDSCGCTPLMDAFRAGQLDITKFLLNKHNSNVNCLDLLGRHSLHISAEAGQNSSIEYLIKILKTNVNLKTKDTSMSPVHYAAKEGFLSTVEYLNELGADLSAKEAKGRTPLHLATAAQHADVVRFLISKGCKDEADLRGIYARSLARKHDMDRKKQGRNAMKTNTAPQVESINPVFQLSGIACRGRNLPPSSLSPRLTVATSESARKRTASSIFSTPPKDKLNNSNAIRNGPASPVESRSKNSTLTAAHPPICQNNSTAELLTDIDIRLLERLCPVVFTPSKMRDEMDKTSNSVQTFSISAPGEAQTACVLANVSPEIIQFLDSCESADHLQIATLCTLRLYERFICFDTSK